MSRYIDADILKANCDIMVGSTTIGKREYVMFHEIDSAPSIDIPRWIPCSERLPRARESVLLAVNHKYGDWVGEGCYWETTDNHIIWKGYRWNATYWDDEIIAWMPLPQPYEETDHE